MLGRTGHLRSGDVAQFEKGGQKVFIAGGEADAQARQVRALRQRMKHHRIGKARAGGFQHAGRLMFAVDLAVAFVGEHQEAVAARQCGQPLQVSARGDRALRIGRRGEIEGDGALQQRIVERVEIGQEGAGARRRQIDRLAAGGQGAGGIGGIKRIGDQHRRQSTILAGAFADPAFGGDCREEQAFARAIEHQHVGVRIDRLRKRVAPIQPACRGLAERLDSLVGRVAAEFIEMGGQHRPDEIGDRMLRFADRQIDDRLARLDPGDEIGQPDERRAAAFGRRRGGRESFALGGHHGHRGTQAGGGARSTWVGHNRRSEVKTRLTIGPSRRRHER